MLSGQGLNMEPVMGANKKKEETNNFYVANDQVGSNIFKELIWFQPSSVAMAMSWEAWIFRYYQEVMLHILAGDLRSTRSLGLNWLILLGKQRVACHSLATFKCHAGAVSMSAPVSGYESKFQRWVPQILVITCNYHNILFFLGGVALPSFDLSTSGFTRFDPLLEASWRTLGAQTIGRVYMKLMRRLVLAPRVQRCDTPMVR